MKISFKLTILCIGLVLVSSVPLFYYAYQETNRSVDDAIRQTLEKDARFSMNSIDRFLYERLSNIRMFADDPVFLPDSLPPLRKRTLVAQKLQHLKQQNELYVSFSFFNKERIRLADTEGLSVGKQHSFSKYWLTAEQEDLVIDISISESLSAPVIHFAGVVRNERGEKAGLLVSRVLLSRLFEVFSNVFVANDEQDIARHLHVSLLDAEGLLLYSNRFPDKILTARYDQLPRLRAHQQKVAEGTELNSYFEDEENIYFYTGQEGYLTYAGQQWTLVLSMPKTVALAPALELRNRMIKVSAVIALVALLIAIGAGQYFTQPLKTLGRAARAMTEGDLSIAMSDPSRTYRRRDEIGQLARTFRKMATDLQQKMDEQRALNQQLTQRYEEIQLKNEEIATQTDKILSQKDDLENALAQIEHRNKKITASINYAQRIQNAILPGEETIRNVFPESFVLFRPRDIVSGDLYWFKLHSFQNRRFAILAVIDCTGHGVPGALMSIIANNLLYQTIAMEQLTDPAEILYKLDRKVNKILKQHQSREAKQDGMDISLLMIDIDNLEALFAGAHQSMLWFHNGVAQVIKGDKFSVGGVFRQEISRTVRTHRLQLHPDDTLYLFSDGMTDQYGGVQLAADDDRPEARKIGKKRLLKLLEDLQAYSFEEQAFKAEEFLEKWQHAEKQTDDITLVGLRCRLTDKPIAKFMNTDEFAMSEAAV